MPKWYVYFLQCNDLSLYCGITTNLAARVVKHNKGLGSKYVAARLPARLVYSEVSENRSTASKREYQLKQLSRTEKLQVIANTFK